MTLVGEGAVVRYRQSDNRRNFTHRLWFVVEAYGVRGGSGDREKVSGGEWVRELARDELDRGGGSGTTMPPRRVKKRQQSSCHVKKGWKHTRVIHVYRDYG